MQHETESQSNPQEFQPAEKNINEQELNPEKSKEELEKDRVINSLIHRGILTPEMVSKFSQQDIDRFVGYQKALNEKPKVEMKEGQFAERDGYPSDECYILVRYGNETAVFRVEILEHLEGESVWENRVKKAHMGTKDTKKEKINNQAISYKSGFERMFEAQISEEHITLDDAVEITKRTQATRIEIEMPSSANYVSILKAVDEIARDYKESFEKYQQERIEEAEEAKQFTIDLMRENMSLGSEEAAKNIKKIALRETLDKGLHYAAVKNFLCFAAGGVAQQLEPPHTIGELTHETFRHLISIFGPRDSLRQIAVYKSFLKDNIDQSYSTSEEKIPDSLLFQGCRMAEVGGNYIQTFEKQGAEVVYPERSFHHGEFGGIKSDEVQITLENYEQFYPEQFDITISREVMDPNSGVETGFVDSVEGSKSLLAVFANITRKGGISIHQGGVVPHNDKYLSILGFEHIFTIRRSDDPIYVFLKIDDTKVTKQDIINE